MTSQPDAADGPAAAIHAAADADALVCVERSMLERGYRVEEGSAADGAIRARKSLSTPALGARRSARMEAMLERADDDTSVLLVRVSEELSATGGRSVIEPAGAGVLNDAEAIVAGCGLESDGVLGRDPYGS